MKKIFSIIFVTIIFNFSTVSYAAEVPPYFSWEIKNLDDYKQYDLLFGNSDNTNLADSRKIIYDWINKGSYSFATGKIGEIEVYQKVAFGVNFFDSSLTELAVKLYLENDEFDTADYKIRLLLDNISDDLSKIRALNLKSDLLNRRGNYREALQLTEEVDQLLKTAPDEKLHLINQSRMARAYCGLNEPQKSLALAEKILPSMEDIFGQADYETFALMSTISKSYCQIQNFDKAMEILSKKLDSANNFYEGNAAVLIKIYLETTDVFAVWNNKESIELLLNASMDIVKDLENIDVKFRLCKQINETATKYLDADNSTVLRSVQSLALLSRAYGKILNSINICEKNLPKFKRIFSANNKETYFLQSTLAENYRDLGKYSEEKKIIEEWRDIYKKIFGGDDYLTINYTIKLADVYYRTGKYKTADKLLDELQTQKANMLDEFSDLKIELLLTKTKGMRMRGKISEATEFLREIRDLNNIDDYEKDLDSEDSKILLMSGTVNDPFNFNLKKMRYYRDLNMEHRIEYLKMMCNLAESYVLYGNLKEGENYIHQIFELSKKNFGENNFYEWTALTTLSKIRRAEGKFTEALEIDNRALKIAEKVCGKNSLERFQTLDSIASEHSAAGNFDEAIKIREKTLSEYKKILEESDAVTIQMMTNLAEDYVAIKKFDDAVKLCDETLELQKIPAYSEDDNISHFPSVTKLIRIKAKAQKLSGDDINAYKNYKKLIKVYEAKRFAFMEIKLLSDVENTARWFESVVPVYKDAASAAASDKVDDTDFVFYCAELCKSRKLIDSFDDILISKTYLLNYSEKKELADKHKLLDSVQSVIEYALSENDSVLRFNAETCYNNVAVDLKFLESKFYEKYSDNKILKTEEKSDSILEKWNGAFNWDKITDKFNLEKNRAIIPNGACFIEFMKVSEDELSVTLLRNEGDLQATNISVDKNFFDNCLLYHELNANAEIDDEELNELRMQIADKLSEKLIPPLEKFAADSSHWIISPDEELNLIPFETLNYKGKLLIEEKDISYVPSLAVMNLMKNRERKNSYLGRKKDLFAMGDAIYEIEDNATSHKAERNFFNKQWVNLEGTAKEIDKVASFFESKDIFKREKASEKILKKMNASGELSGYKYLLFATHGIFVPEKPEYSAIVLSQDYNDEEDGYITVVEWMNYDLRSNLIYLSACESGLGDYQAGEGIVGIPYALTVAGNKDTVMSLWKVNDEATAEFTVAVFEKLRRGDTEVSALNKTKREFLKQNNPLYKNPSIWAAFVLYGF